MQTRLYERTASALIGTPLQAPAEKLRSLLGVFQRLRHPELRDIYLEHERIQALLKKVVSDGSNCIDVGCHLGAVLQQIVALSPNGSHIAIEPLPYKAQWLARKFPRVDVRQVAASDSDRTVEFYFNTRRSAFSALRVECPADGHEKILVECRRLDDLALPGRRFDFLKIDVEGGEYAALSGAVRLIASSQPIILFECTRPGLANAGRKPGEIYDLLVKDIGYRIFLLKDWLAGAGGVSLAAFEAAMSYPFKAFNFVAAPVHT